MSGPAADSFIGSKKKKKKIIAKEIWPPFLKNFKSDGGQAGEGHHSVWAADEVRPMVVSLFLVLRKIHLFEYFFLKMLTKMPVGGHCIVVLWWGASSEVLSGHDGLTRGNLGWSALLKIGGTGAQREAASFERASPNFLYRGRQSQPASVGPFLPTKPQMIMST